MIEKGGLDFDVLVSKFYDLDQVESAFADLEAGKIVGRAVVKIPH
jgi:Zn-dependent alcohol dehydrogenase